MADHDHRSIAPIRPDPRSLSDIEYYEDDPAPFDHAPFDPATLDPNEFEWRPVPRRPRADGWTPEVQCAFIQALADGGLVEHAARAVDMSVQSAYRLRRAPGGESFARAWTVALSDAAQRVLDIAFARAIEGDDTPVFDRDGCRIGARRKISDRMTMFLLRAYMPDRFRHAAHESVRQPTEAPAPVLPSLAEALAALTPLPPEDPHLLLAPDRLESLVAHARDMAAVDALCPPDDHERYVAPRVEADHPAATERGILRRRASGAKAQERNPKVKPEPVPFDQDADWPHTNAAAPEPPPRNRAARRAAAAAGKRNTPERLP